PIEVESVLNAHPDVQESAVAEVRVKDDTTVIAAFIVARRALNPDALQAFARGRLARYKMPRLFIEVSALPKGPNGKLLRKQARRNYEDENGQA
ncbi:MAG: benzoate--CoA ligase, partial [Halocynthiibacter sp.]